MPTGRAVRLRTACANRRPPGRCGAGTSPPLAVPAAPGLSRSPAPAFPQAGAGLRAPAGTPGVVAGLHANTSASVCGMRAEDRDPDSKLVTTSSTVVYSNRWITVREDQTLRPDGSAGVYGVVHKADFALIVPFADGGFYLVEQYRYPVSHRYWEFPQGASEDSPGTDPILLARAELAEETGLTAANLTPLGWLYPSYGFCDHGFHIMVATGLTPGEVRPEPDEVGMRSQWFPEAAVWQLIAEGKITDAHTVAALGLFQQHRSAYGW